MICDHNEKLASRDQKNIFKFVTIIFFIFGAEPLGIFFVVVYKDYNDYKI